MTQEDLFVQMMEQIGQEYVRDDFDKETNYVISGNYAWASFWFMDGQLINLEVSE